MINAAKPQGPVVIQIHKTKDESLGKYMYSSVLLFPMDKSRGLAVGIRTDVYTGVLATAITETIRNLALLFERLHSKVELWDADSGKLLEVFDLNNDDVIKMFMPLDLLKQTNYSVH